MSIAQNEKTEILWYKRPAERWIEALPIGNAFICPDRYLS
jgi:hypothetical protein